MTNESSATILTEATHVPGEYPEGRGRARDSNSRAIGKGGFGLTADAFAKHLQGDIAMHLTVLVCSTTSGFNTN